MVVTQIYNKNLFQLKKLGPLGTPQTKYEWFLVSGFIEDFLKIGQKVHKITHNSIEIGIAPWLF